MQLSHLAIQDNKLESVPHIGNESGTMNQKVDLFPI